MFLVILPIFDTPITTGISAAITISGIPVYFATIYWQSKPKMYQNVIGKMIMVNALHLILMIILWFIQDRLIGVYKNCSYASNKRTSVRTRSVRMTKRKILPVLSLPLKRIPYLCDLECCFAIEFACVCEITMLNVFYRLKLNAKESNKCAI